MSRYKLFIAIWLHFFPAHLTKQEKLGRPSQWVCLFNGLVTEPSWECAVHNWSIHCVENTINLRCELIAVHRRNELVNKCDCNGLIPSMYSDCFTS